MSGANPDRPRICVVGAGIAGLAAAWQIRTSAPDAELVVLETASRPGGVIRTSQFAGRAVDEAADAFLARVDDGTRLCAELGLADDLVAPATGQAFVHLDGELVPLPRAQFLGVPLDLDGLDGKVLSPAGVAALQEDLNRPAPPPGGSAGTDRRGVAEPPSGIGRVPSWGGSRAGAEPRSADCSIGTLIRSRLGAEVLERLVGPLVGSINAGDCDRLSLHAAAPALAEAARADASLIRALREQGTDRSSREITASGPVFWGLRGGMERLTASLAERLAPALSFHEPAVALRVDPAGPAGPSVHSVETPDRSISCDGVVLAVGAQQCAGLVAPWAPEAAALLERTGTASVAIVALAYQASEVPQVTAGSGFVVPAASGLAITACSWASTKWAHLGASASGDGMAILRVSLGRHGDDTIVRQPEATLVAAVRAGLEATMGITAAPAEVRVSRWPDAFPQYAVGHVERTVAVEAALGASGVFCAGASFHGVGIPSCIGSGRRAGRAALARALHRGRP